MCSRTNCQKLPRTLNIDLCIQLLLHPHHNIMPYCAHTSEHRHKSDACHQHCAQSSEIVLRIRSPTAPRSALSRQLPLSKQRTADVKSTNMRNLNKVPQPFTWHSSCCYRRRQGSRWLVGCMAHLFPHHQSTGWRCPPTSFWFCSTPGVPVPVHVYHRRQGRRSGHSEPHPVTP